MVERLVISVAAGVVSALIVERLRRRRSGGDAVDQTRNPFTVS